MIVTAIVDPGIFDNNIETEIILKNIEQFLYRVINGNIILLVDDQNQIITEYINFLKKANSRMSQIRILLEEILKIKHRKIVCVKNIADTKYFITFDKITCTQEPDAVVITSNLKNKLKTKCRKYSHLSLDLNNYEISSFEKLSKYYYDIPPLSNIPKDKVDDVFTRALKYSQQIKFYDKQIAKTLQNKCSVKKYISGISYFLGLALKKSFYLTEIEIYTCLANKLHGDMEKDFIKDINIEIIDKIKSKCNITPRIYVKHDKNEDFHARYLLSQHCSILIDRSFDFIKSNGDFKKTIIQCQQECAQIYTDEFANCTNLYEL